MWDRVPKKSGFAPAFGYQTKPIPILPCCFVCCSYSVNTHDVGNHPQQEIEIENPI